ncbi:hypothetical protein NE237_014624 [Protea cynaroides]|uniref:Uncharacterized protein n=1 Tax=Protea cynaroides TaxID=273540 RepID=A0A9Q0KCB5_9MAGN|nr:hypothetical protein NE237_014624 [Protea cynaroides]
MLHMMTIVSGASAWESLPSSHSTKPYLDIISVKSVCKKGASSKILCHHDNEVWFLQFSNNGEYLASSSSDCTAIIWKVSDEGDVSLKHTLRSHKNSVSFVAWSPDDTMLLTCGNGEVFKLWDVETGTSPNLTSASTCGTLMAMSSRHGEGVVPDPRGLIPKCELCLIHGASSYSCGIEKKKSHSICIKVFNF